MPPTVVVLAAAAVALLTVPWAPAPAQPAPACAPVPAGFRAERRARSGSQCADILTLNDADGTRRLRVFVAGAPGFQLDGAVSCRECGGMKGDPLADLSWRRGSLVVGHWGGSGSGYWNTRWYFAPRGGRWVLAGWSRVVSDGSYHDVLKESVNTLTGRAILTYLPAEQGCAAAERESEGAYRCRFPRNTTRQCAVSERAPPPRSVLALDERPWSCGAAFP